MVIKLSVGRRTVDWLNNWKKRPGLLWGLSIGWLLLLGWIVFFWRLGSIGLIDETEPLFVEAARQMTVTGDWITPYFNEVTRFDKPPLIYWLMAIAFKAFGVNEWAARLPSALAGLTLSGFCFYTLRRFGIPTQPTSANREPLNESLELAVVEPSDRAQGWLTAWLGATMVALHPYTFFFGRTGYSDMLLSACMGGSLLAFFIGYAQPEKRSIQDRWYLLCYVLLALAVLTKGPVGVVLPAMIVGAFLLYVGKFKEVLRELRLLRGAAIVLGISLPWFILVTLANGEAYINSFFGYHNLERFTSVVNQHQGPWYFHFLVVLVGFLPWSIFLPTAIARLQLQRRQRWQQQPRATHLGLFAGFWFAVVLGFFTIAATKYFSYSLPSIPAAAILVGLWWSDQIIRAQRDRPSRNLNLHTLVGIGICLLLAVVSFYSPHWLGDDPTMPNLAVRIQQSGLGELGAVIWGLSTIAGISFLVTRRAHWFWGVSLVGFAAFLLLVVTPVSAIVDAERQLPLRQIAQAAVQAERPGEPLFMIVKGFHKPSLVFYTQKPINFLMQPESALAEIEQSIAPPAPPDSALVIASERALQAAQVNPAQYQPVAEAGIYQLFRISQTGRR